MLLQFNYLPEFELKISYPCLTLSLIFDLSEVDCVQDNLQSTTKCPIGARLLYCVLDISAILQIQKKIYLRSRAILVYSIPGKLNST